jgi:opacity protein-like surface antigen
MQRFLAIALFTLAAAGFARAQDPVVGPFSQTKLSVAAVPEAASVDAEAAPAAPEPRYVYGNRNDFRWQLALGVSLVRFRSPLYYATGVGTNTSITYFTNEWLGVEASVNTAFGGTILQGERVKYVGYGAGPKVAWRRANWEPWAHTIVGGMHIVPQQADLSKNGFALQVGGGADYRIFPHLSARIEVDWLKIHVFGVWTNSAQANADIVLHF